MNILLLRKQRNICVMLLFLVAFYYSIPSTAQSGIFIDTLKWSVSSIIQVDVGETVDVETSFITYGVSKIEWIQLTNIKRTFNVIESQIDWPDINGDGRAEFLVELSTLRGKILFKKEYGVVSIEFSFLKDGQLWLPFRFSIDSIIN